MRWIRWIVVLLALVEGGWLLFDGLHAFVTGDYVTPSSGRHAGQLGPWSRLWIAVGIEPRSMLVRSVHVGLGAVWLACTAAYVAGWPPARTGMLACAVAGAWYLPFGTLLSLVQIVLLLCLAGPRG
jgi:hypothetical protein